MLPRTVITAVFLMLATLLAQPASGQQPFSWVQDDVDLYHLDVIRVDLDKLTVRVTELGSRRSFRVPADFRFYIDDQPVSIHQLQPKQKLRAYVTRGSKGELMLVDAGPVRDQPPATPPSEPVIAPVVAEPALAMLPATASPMPAILLGGLLLLVTAFSVRMIRKRS